MKKTISSEFPRFYDPLVQAMKNIPLMIAFSRRDIKIQYAQTILGVVWIVLQPLIATAIYTIFFNHWVKLDSGMMPFPIYVLTGFIIWQYFSFLVINSGTSLIQNQKIITRIYIPKLVAPFSRSFAGLLSICVCILLLIALMIWYSFTPSITILLLPVFILGIMITGLSLGIWLCALSFRYRDLNHLAGIIIGYGIWVTPVFYPTNIIPENLSYLLYFNPVAGIIEGVRWSVSGGTLPEAGYLLGIIPVVILLITGLLYFNRVDRKIADLL
ncbi:MAG: ABC transporter permease [Bacteroidota bacterium]